MAPYIDREGLGAIERPEDLHLVRQAMEQTFKCIHDLLETLTVRHLEGGDDVKKGDANIFPTAIDARESGTTGTMVLTGRHAEDGSPWILIGHIGDGKCCLFREVVFVSCLCGGRGHGAMIGTFIRLRRWRGTSTRASQEQWSF